MTPNTTTNLLRTLFVIFAAAIGAFAGYELSGNTVAGIILGLIFGLLLVLFDRLLHGFSLRAFSSATFGLILGLVFSRLLTASDILKYLPEDIAWAISLFIYTIFGYLGMMLAMRSNRDEFSLIIPYVRFARQSVHDAPIVVDSNILIDGRISRIVETGFLSGSVVIPDFVIDELQQLADSSDSHKRESGRRGLDNISLMERSSEFDVTIHKSAVPSALAVDQQLANVAGQLGARLLTNDTPLAKVARLQNVVVLNLNELQSAIRPPLTPGQKLQLLLTKQGKDPHQAVGFIEDGTMIVVNNAATRIGQHVDIEISSTLKTSAGRLFFANLIGDSTPSSEQQGDSNS